MHSSLRTLRVCVRKQNICNTSRSPNIFFILSLELLLKERIYSLREQILSFMSSPRFGNNTKENFPRFFLDNIVLTTALISH